MSQSWRPVRGRWSCSSQAAILQDVFECSKRPCFFCPMLQQCSQYWKDIEHAVSLMLASLSLRKSDVCGIAKRLSGTGISGVCVISLHFWTGWTQAVFRRAIDPTDRSSWSCPEKHKTHCQRSVLRLSTQVDWKKMETNIAQDCQRTGSGKTMAFAMPYLSMSRPEAIMRQKRQDKRHHFQSFSSIHMWKKCQAWAARGFRAAMCFATLRGHGAYKASCNVLRFCPRFMSSFLQVHLWQGAGHADSRGALCFGVLADSHMDSIQSCSLAKRELHFEWDAFERSSASVHHSTSETAETAMFSRYALIWWKRWQPEMRLGSEIVLPCSDAISFQGTWVVRTKDDVKTYGSRNRESWVSFPQK